MELLKELRPIEILYLISKEKPEVLDKKNRLQSLLYFLIKNKNLEVNKTLKVISFGTKYSRVYEESVITLLQEKKYLELDKFIDKLIVFNQTLVDNGFLSMKVVAKKMFFLNLAKNEISKTSKYYESQLYFNQEFEKGIPVLDIVGDDRKLREKSVKAFIMIKNLMIAAKKAEEELRQKKDRTGI